MASAKLGRNVTGKRLVFVLTYCDFLAQFIDFIVKDRGINLVFRTISLPETDLPPDAPRCELERSCLQYEIDFYSNKSDNEVSSRSSLG